MSAFKEKLNQVLDNEGADKKPSSASVIKSNQVYFSFTTFIIGLGLGFLILGSLIGWTFLSADKNAIKMAERLPSKTAIVEVIGSETYRMSDAQPVLRMPDSDTVELDIHEMETVPSEEEKAIRAMIEENAEDHTTAHHEGSSEHAENHSTLNPDTTFYKYKKAAPSLTGQPTISIVITDVGLSKSITEQLLKDMPKEVSLAVSPYAENVELLVDAVHKDGHEVWMMMPSETVDYPLTDAGPLALLTNLSAAENDSRISKIISFNQGYVGLIPSKDHIFKTEDSNINPAIGKIFESGLAVLDSNVNGRSFVENIAYKNDYPYARNNFWLDQDLAPMALNQRIRQIMDFTEANGSSVVMLSAQPASIKALEKFLNSAASKKFQLVPASAMVKNVQ